MGLLKSMKNDDPKQLQAAVTRAQAAWDQGRRCFIYKPSALAMLAEEGLNTAVEDMLSIGWELHSTALVFNQVGMNTEQAMFTFVRPKD